MGLGTNSVTGGLTSIAGLLVLLIAFYFIPGRQKFVFLGLWLCPVVLLTAFDSMAGVYLWGIGGFWVSLFLVGPVSEKLGMVPKESAEKADKNRQATPTVDSPKTHRQPGPRPAPSLQFLLDLKALRDSQGRKMEPALDLRLQKLLAEQNAAAKAETPAQEPAAMSGMQVNEKPKPLRP